MLQHTKANAACLIHMLLSYLPNEKWPRTFMAAAFDLPNPPGTDCVEISCVHLFDKQEVGRRLALAAPPLLYPDEPQTLTSAIAPMVSQILYESNGYMLTIKFNETLLTPGGIEVRSTIGFEVNDGGGTWGCSWQAAPIVNHTWSSVTISAIAMPVQITGVRYAWADTPCPHKQCAVYSAQAGIPLPPFHVQLAAPYQPCVDPVPVGPGPVPQAIGA